LVKGRMDTKLYYTPDNPPYDAGVAQVWFIDEESAAAAGFTPMAQTIEGLTASAGPGKTQQ